MIIKRKTVLGVGRVISFAVAISWLATTVLASQRVSSNANVRAALEKIALRKGICVVLGLPKSVRADFVTKLADASELTIYFQSPNTKELTKVRTAAEAASLLGTRIFVEKGDWDFVHLADNLAGAVLVGSSAEGKVGRQELLRVLHPEGNAISGNEKITKRNPDGTDDWSHPYHSPDNNPLSSDQIARAPYRTQFLADPKFSPMPAVSVVAGGRIFKAFGHISHKSNQNALLNTLLGVNAYNGTILWKRELKKGFMIHRNTMIATADALYMGDDESCKLIDARTGKIRDRIVIPEGISDGPVWKWMALQDGVLYALIGGREIEVDTQRSEKVGLGHWPWGMWKGHDYKNPRTSFGFGRTFVALDPSTKKILWSYKDEEFLDSRAVCMKNGRIFFYSPEKFLGCLDAKNGKILWKNSDDDLIEAIGPNERAQRYVTGYSTTVYMKCNENFIFFAGPQRKKLVAASTGDGKLLWQRPNGNLQLVLREDGLYAAGPAATGLKLAYESGEELAQLPTRRACTRATGSVDSIFYRTSGGTVRLDVASNTAQHIAPMRPPCQDGVIISDGMLYWGPWMCGCQLSLYGHISLASAGNSNGRLDSEKSRRQLASDDPASVANFEVSPGDWSSYQGDNQRKSTTNVSIPDQVDLRWKFQLPTATLPTAPVIAGGIVFVGDRSGILRALDADGYPIWKSYTGGAIYYPPAVSQGRVYVGSADGRVHAFEAATGRKLWSFRVAPSQRWIPVYGKLISTWPVAGGVVVKDGTVYAAAGIAHYDGTHVVALDAVTGELKMHNGSSGSLSQKVNSGISLQGNLYLQDGQLRFLAGGVHETARFDLETLECLNTPTEKVTSQFHTAFYAHYPEYGKYSSLDYTFPDGKKLSHDASYEGSRFTNLALLAPLPPGVTEPKKPASRWTKRTKGQKPRKALWREKTGRRFTSFIVAPGVLLAAGHTVGDQQTNFLAAIDIQDGHDIWRKDFPATVVKGGTAIDHQGRIVVCSEDGQVLCFIGRQD